MTSKRWTVLVIVWFIPLAALSQSQPDTLLYGSFKENYHTHCALVNDGKWATALGNRPIGWRWKLVADEFEAYPEAEEAYRLARQQARQGFLRTMAGGVLTVISVPISGTYQPFDLQTGVGLGMALGGVALIMNSASRNIRSENNFENALWLRNRDEMLGHVPPLHQPHFRNIYQTETIYLTHDGYVKNGKAYPVGWFGKKAAKEFETMPAAWDSYRKYQRSQRIGMLVYATGVASVIAFASSLGTTKRRPDGNVFFLGGTVTAAVGAGILTNARSHLKNAVFLRNYTALERKLLWE